MDVDRVIETARAMPIPADQEILHILTQEFIIDDQDGICEPIGMSGFRLEVKVHIVTGAVSAAQNIVKCGAPLWFGSERSCPATARFELCRSF